MATQRTTTNTGTYRRSGSGSYNTYRNTYRSTNAEYSDDNTYIYGNVVRKTDVQRQMEEPQRRSLSREVQANRAKAKYMNLGYVLFLAAALAVAGMVLISYVRVQSEITTTMEYITTQEKVLNNLRVSNDEAMTRIESHLDLEEVKRVAIGELGMTYPKEGQIITYEALDKDYVRKILGED